MKIKVLYPSSYPICDHSNYWYVESPLSADYNFDALKLIKENYVFVDIELPLTANEIIRTNLKVLKKLNRNNSPITSYTIQYEDRSNKTIIRADNNHPYPHIDLQLPDGNKEKRVFDTDPSDYEASVNTVLRYAEFYNSHTIGIDYWLFNVTAFKRELIHSFFNTTRGYFKSSTAYFIAEMLKLMCRPKDEGSCYLTYHILTRIWLSTLFRSSYTKSTCSKHLPIFQCLHGGSSASVEWVNNSRITR